MLQLEGDNALEEDFGQIYGLSAWESRKANVSSDKVLSLFLSSDCQIASTPERYSIAKLRIRLVIPLVNWNRKK